MKLRLTHYGTDVVMVVSLVLCTGAILAGAYFWPVLPPVLILWGWALYFFRDPHREAPANAKVMVAPADGKIVAVERTVGGAATGSLTGELWRVDIFLSIFNVHINRAPCAGTVRNVSYRKGKFLNALRPEASSENESNDVTLCTSEGVPVLVRQIAGIIARRIVCDCIRGDRLCRGERFGMIKFGSRTELYVPFEAVRRISVKVGDRVKAGSTTIGELR